MSHFTLPMPRLGRRNLLLGALGTTAALGLGGCGTKSEGSGGTTVTVGSYQSDDVPRKAFADMMKGFTKGEVQINTIQHETFKEGINNYIQGNPDDVFTWFAGYRARAFAEKGLVADLSEVWADIKGMPESMRNASSDAGKPIFVPSTYYPWGIFYRPSVWKERGYQVPGTADEWMTLNEKMAKDGLTPIAFSDKDGWEAMGTFDMLNLRLNGYEFHVDLMAGKEAWDGEKVKKVFTTWAQLMPFHQADPLGRTWQEAAQGLLKKQSGMYVMGMFIDQQFQKTDAKDDLDFFPFPEFDKAIGTDVVEAPVDGFMMAAKPKNKTMAMDLLRYLATPEAVNITVKADPSVIAANEEADQSKYTKLQTKAVTLISQAKNISQFLDRDTRPDFASTVIGPSLQEFVKKPSDIDAICSRIEQQKKSIFA